MKKKKVGIVGVGNVGSTLAFTLVMKNLCDCILLKDIRDNFTQAMALDISQAASCINSKTIVKAISNDEDFCDCDIIVITAGIPRKPNMSRDDLLFTNAKIMTSIVKNVIKYNENAIIIIVSNPLDAMVYWALKASKWKRNKILGMAGVLDTSRLCHFIKEKVGPKNIKTLVLGGHGDEMIPLINSTTVDDKPLKDFLNDKEISEIVEKTKNGGIEIVKLLQTGSAYYAPANSTALMVEAILKDKKEIFPCAMKLDGEYGHKDVVIGVPVVLGKNGAETIIEKELNDIEKSEFSKSVSSVKTLIEKLEESSK
ncbi:malate dehydrogenase [Halarcobacter sp.]|uniref:malate dehydrogenase n=1 Tax=Halarcobacter sp. TaxID=2321133 RepID=UPI002AABABA4|nr:malate dehydrogenase [Halarcobacter sp.]